MLIPDSRFFGMLLSVLLLTAGAAHAQAPTYDSSARHDFSASHAAVAARQVLASGWTDESGQVYSVSGGSLKAVSADTTGYLRALALRPAAESADTPNVEGTIDVPNGLPSLGTANGLVLRFQPDGTFYLFQLSPDKLYAYKVSGGSRVTLLQSVAVHPEPSDPYSLTGSAITTAASVALAVTATDTKTGKPIGSLSTPDYSDPILAAGQVGVDSWVGNNAGGTVTERYSRIVFRRVLPKASSTASPKIGFIGDSITAGYNQQGRTITPGADDAAALTIQKLAGMRGTAQADSGVAWSAYDQGVSGAGSGDWLPGSSGSREARAKTAFTLAFGNPNSKTNPVWVLLMLGTNDVRSDNLFTAQRHQQNLQAITEDLVADGYNVVINHAPAFVAPTSFNGVAWSAASLSLLQSYLPGEKAVADSFQARAPGRVFFGDASAFDYFAAHPTLFQEYGVYGGLHPNGSGGTDALASFWEKAFVRIYLQKSLPVTAQVICHGDSLTAGYNASSGLLTATGTTYPGVLAEALGPAWRVVNIGTGGWPLGALIGEAPAKVDPLFDPHLKQNVLIVFGGTNDLGGGHKSAETAFGALISYCRARHAAHPWRILVVTPPVAAYPNVYPADFDAQMVRYDTLIRRNWRYFADGIVDVGADPRLGVPGAEHNAAYFSPKDFTHLTDAGYAIVGRDAALAVLSVPAKSVPASVQAPRLTFGNRAVQSKLGTAYNAALENLLRINTVPDLAHAHDASGLLTGDPAFFIRAGGGYDQPWTRDASLNSWNAASLLEPQAARNTLWAVCQRSADGTLTIQQDNQWWDKVIWITGAWNHYLVTGDRAFLTSAYGVAQDELARMQREHYNAQYGLFQGPAVFADGIAGYPEPEYDPKNNSSFVLDHPYTSQLMVLSTNCVYYNAYKCAAQMATELKRPASEAAQYSQSAAALKAAINTHLWMPEKSTYGYFIHGAGPLAGHLDPTQEGIGQSFAILFGVASPAQAKSVLQNAYRSPHGITASWPHFPRFDDAHPGRHNAVVWPLVNGMFACAAAEAGRTDLFGSEAENAALLAARSGNHFFEIYNGLTGVPDGGWQNGGHWNSEPDQTWSATAYLRMIDEGLFGMRFTPSALTFAPTLPAAWGPATLSGLHYRAAVLSIALKGHGTRITRFVYDGKPLAHPVIPATATGSHTVVMTLG